LDAFVSRQTKIKCNDQLGAVQQNQQEGKLEHRQAKVLQLKKHAAEFRVAEEPAAQQRAQAFAAFGQHVLVESKLRAMDGSYDVFETMHSVETGAQDAAAAQDVVRTDKAGSRLWGRHGPGPGEKVGADLMSPLVQHIPRHKKAKGLKEAMQTNLGSLFRLKAKLSVHVARQESSGLAAQAAANELAVHHKLARLTSPLSAASSAGGASSGSGMRPKRPSAAAIASPQRGPRKGSMRPESYSVSGAVCAQNESLGTRRPSQRLSATASAATAVTAAYIPGGPSGFW
jgi:hypothetical protein